MRLKLDTVNLTEFTSSAYDGRYIRTGLIYVTLGELPAHIPSPDPVVKALSVQGMPQKGDVLPIVGYDDWIARRFTIRPITALIYAVIITYEWLGALRVRDTSSLTMEMSQIHPINKKPFIVTYTRPGAGAGSQPIKKQLSLPVQLPMRHLVMTKTVKYQARVDVLNAFGSVNQFLWEGLKPGYWLFSGLDGDSMDNGQTYTYSVILSTRMIRDWSEYGGIEDDRGNKVVMTAAEIVKMKALLNKDYVADIDVTVNGFLKSGNQAMADFGAILGVQ